MNADERAIRYLVALWHSATAAGDVDTVLGLMDEDVVFLVAGQPRGSWRVTPTCCLRYRDGTASANVSVVAMGKASSLGHVGDKARLQVTPNMAPNRELLRESTASY